MMSDTMTFPETWEEFEKSYGFIDSEEVYTNGSRLIPSFRVKQWLEHEETKQQATVSSDCISRQAVLDLPIKRDICWFDGSVDEWINVEDIKKLPSAQQCMTATSNTMVSDTVKIPVMDGTTERLPSAEQRKNGKWIFIHPLQADDEGAYICSNCHRGDWDIKPTDKYCKFCGMAMDIYATLLS